MEVRVVDDEMVAVREHLAVLAGMTTIVDAEAPAEALPREAALVEQVIAAVSAA